MLILLSASFFKANISSEAIRFQPFITDFINIQLDELEISYYHIIYSPRSFVEEAYLVVTLKANPLKITCETRWQRHVQS